MHFEKGRCAIWNFKQCLGRAFRIKEELENRYHEVQKQGLNLNMARGKPSMEQLELSMPMLDTLNSRSKMTASTGEDCRNYGMADGLPELACCLQK